MSFVFLYYRFFYCGFGASEKGLGADGVGFGAERCCLCNFNVSFVSWNHCCLLLFSYIGFLVKFDRCLQGRICADWGGFGVDGGDFGADGGGLRAAWKLWCWTEVILELTGRDCMLKGKD